MNTSYIRRLKNARKNAQREIDTTCRKEYEREICLKYSRPLYVECKHLSEFDYMIRVLSAKKYKSFSRVARAIFKDGKIVTFFDLLRFHRDNEIDLRKINGSMR